MSNPNAISEFQDKLFELHKDAGLIFSGKDGEGEELWLGTSKQWEFFEALEAKFLEDFNNNT